MELNISLNHNTNSFIGVPVNLLDRLNLFDPSSSRSDYGFLALQLNYFINNPDGTTTSCTAFVGWGGETSYMVKNLEISIQFAQCLKLTNGQEVENI
jgi:hypothetical protein